jgi:hypothetical protein
MKRKTKRNNKFIVSENTEVILDGKKFLLEKGEEITINERFDDGDVDGYDIYDDYLVLDSLIKIINLARKNIGNIGATTPSDYKDYALELYGEIIDIIGYENRYNIPDPSSTPRAFYEWITYIKDKEAEVRAKFEK